MSAGRGVKAALAAALLFVLPAAIAGCPQPAPGGGGGGKPPPQAGGGGAGGAPAAPRAEDQPIVAGRVAVLKSGDQRQYDLPIEPFTTSLGQEVNVFNLHGDRGEKAKATIDKVVASKPPLVFAIGGSALDLVRAGVKGVPIVFTHVLNAAKHGVKDDENVAGVEFEVPPETQLTQLKIVAPGVKKIGIIHGAGTREVVEQARAAAQELKLDLLEVEVAAAGDVPDAWGDKLKGKVDALWMVPDAVFDADAFRFLKDETLAAPAIPFLGPSDKFVEAGALMSVSGDYAAMGSQVGIAASRILAQEATPKECGIAPPVGTVSALNVKTAETIGLKIDDAILKNVDQVIGAPEPGEPK